MTKHHLVETVLGKADMDPLHKIDSDRKLNSPVHNQEKHCPVTKEDLSATVQALSVSWSACISVLFFVYH